MSGKRAKRIRAEVYGNEITLMPVRRYEKGNHGELLCQGFRALYKEAKKTFYEKKRNKKIRYV